MPTVGMRDLTLSVRGVSRSRGGTGAPPAHIMGMVSSVRSAIREVHATSPQAGETKIRTSLGGWLGWAGDSNPGRRASATAAANYISAVEQCASWQSLSPLTYRTWEAKGTVCYNASDAIEVVVRVVLENSTGGVWGRLILWDTPPLPQQAAHLLASPAVEFLDQRFGQQRIAGVELWQCRTGETYVVDALDARSMRGAVAQHVAKM